MQLQQHHQSSLSLLWQADRSRCRHQVLSATQKKRIHDRGVSCRCLKHSNDKQTTEQGMYIGVLLLAGSRLRHVVSH